MAKFITLKNFYLNQKNNFALSNQTLYDEIFCTQFLTLMGYAEFAANVPLYNETPEIDLSLSMKNTVLYARFLNTADILDSDIRNYTAYLYRKTNSENVYGILTNGIEYILVNSFFHSPNDAVMGCIIRLHLINTTHKNKQRYFDYFQKSALFDYCTTECFKAIALFKIYYQNSNKTVYGQYISTLENFFYDFAPPHFAKSGHSFKNVKTQNVINYLNKKQAELNSNSGRKIAKKDSIQNSYTHIIAFYRCLKEHNHIPEIPIDEHRQLALNLYPPTIANWKIFSIENDDIKKMLSTLTSSRQAIRNITIFTLCAYLGLERNVISSLNWNNIELYGLETTSFLVIDKKKIPLNSFLVTCLTLLKKQSVAKLGTINGNDPVFLSSHKKRLRANGINDIFEIFRNLADDTDSKWYKLTPSMLRFSLIEKLYKNGYSIDEIIYITGIEPQNIHNYIQYDKVIDCLSKHNIFEPKPSFYSLLINYHPYKNIFSLQEFDLEKIYKEETVCGVSI